MKLRLFILDCYSSYIFTIFYIYKKKVKKEKKIYIYIYLFIYYFSLIFLYSLLYFYDRKWLILHWFNCTILKWYFIFCYFIIITVRSNIESWQCVCVCSLSEPYLPEPSKLFHEQEKWNNEIYSNNKWKALCAASGLIFHTFVIEENMECVVISFLRSSL